MEGRRYAMLGSIILKVLFAVVVLYDLLRDVYNQYPASEDDDHF